MKVTINALVFIGLLICILSCNDNKKCKTTTIMDPNPSSELTLLMRDMYDHYDFVAKEIGKGKVPKKVNVYENIHTAKATQPAKSESDLYKAMAKVYIESAKNLSNSKNDVHQNFNLLVDNCMNCHKQMCPGPMVKIEKLYLPKSI